MHQLSQWKLHFSRYELGSRDSRSAVAAELTVAAAGARLRLRGPAAALPLLKAARSRLLATKALTTTPAGAELLLYPKLDLTPR